MRMCTRSKRVIKAIDRVLWRLPPKDREVIERFVFRITSVRAWTPVHVDGVDSTSAMLTRFWKAGDGGIKCERRPTGELHCERTGDTYDAQVCFNLPVVRLFSDRALLGIVAHEFAHGCIAARLGQGWYEKMTIRAQAHERAADELATLWGFGKEIRLMRKERDHKVSAILYSRVKEIRRGRRAEIRRSVRRARLLLEQYDRSPVPGTRRTYAACPRSPASSPRSY